MKIPNPERCGLPERISKWRPTQEEAIATRFENTKRATSLCVPTGEGKSAIAVGIAKIADVPTCIVTNSRGLQDQYSREFSSIGLVDLRGRNNYSCGLKDDFTCDDGHAARCPYKGTVQCPASQAEMRAGTSNLVVTNYAKWCSTKKFGMGLSHIQQVIFDEFHDAPQALASAMQVTLHYKEIEEGLKIPFLEGAAAEQLHMWKAWARTTKPVAEDAMIQAQARISGVVDPKPSWVRHFSHMRNLVRRLSILASANAREWIVEQTEDGYKFDPIRPGRYAESALLFRVPKIVALSATIRPKTMYMVGIGKDNFEFKEFDSNFDRRRCPVYYKPTMRVDAKHPDLRLLWATVDQIASKRRDRKGLVHTVSFTRRDEIISSSRFSGSMLFNPKGEPTSAIIEEFRSAGPGSILVSPSVGTGYDFKGKDAEWQFICKIPFEPPSKIVKAREADDREYRSYQAMQALVQMCGRLMRFEMDQGETFLADDNLQWFLPKFRHLAPKSFHNFFQQVSSIPAPPPPL